MRHSFLAISLPLLLLTHASHGLFLAARLPTTLNVPGLLGDRGVLEFAEDVWLDYEHPDNAITVSFPMVLALGP